jgi:uncharacterized membrane protein YkoI
MARHTKRNAIVAGAAAVLAGLGITAAAAAQNGPSAPAGPSAGQSEQRGQEDPSYTGSITAPDEGKDDDTRTGADEAAEAQALQGLATVSADQARDAALAAVPGTANKVELDNENGSVVYSVEVTGADGTVTDVKVDAGNGQVLAQDSGEDPESEQGGEGNEAPGTEQPDGTEQPEPAPAG